MRYFVVDSIEAAANPPIEVMTCSHQSNNHSVFSRLFKLLLTWVAATVLFVGLLSVATFRSSASEKIGDWIASISTHLLNAAR